MRKLYQVHVVMDNTLHELIRDLGKEEAEATYIKKCNFYYSDNGLFEFSKKNNIASDKLTREHFEEYYASPEYYEACDFAHVEMEQM